jgi:diguanylate cyclase (GGDEF)-like protein/PAS domain S-box-containing protein
VTPDEAAAQARALRTLHEVVVQINADLDLPATLQAVVDGVVEGLGFGIAAVNLVRADGDLEVVAVAGSAEARAALLGSVGPRVDWDALLGEGEPWGALLFYGHDRGVESLSGAVPTWSPDYVPADVPDAWHPLDELLAPLCGRGGALLGVLSVDLPTDGRRPDLGQRELLELFAGQAGVAIDNARTHSELSSLLARLFTVVEAAPVAIYETDLTGRARLWNTSAEQVFGWSRREVLGSPLPWREIVGRPSLDEPMRRYEVTRSRPDGGEVVVDVADALLRDRDGNPQGYLSVAADVTSRRRLEEELRRHATTDALTGLANRKHFDDRLQQSIARARRDGGAVGVLLLDLDGFKPVNDRYGHARGDEVLVELARRLAECVRTTDTLARLGGDEFVVLVEGPDVAAAAREVAGRIVTGVRAPIGDVRLSVSVGVAVVEDAAAHADPGAELLRRADAAMYAAKSAGKDGAHSFDTLTA